MIKLNNQHSKKPIRTSEMQLMVFKQKHILTLNGQLKIPLKYLLMIFKQKRH